MTTAYPLAWPAGWPRKSDSQRTDARFNRKARQTINYSGGGSSSYMSSKALTVSDGVKRVLDELARLNARPGYTVISTDVVLRLDALPRSGQRKPADPGAAVYWRDCNGEQRVLAIDRYRAVANNLAAIAATLEALRAIERHGGAQILERAFSGFTALPALGAMRSWREVIGVGPDERDLAAVRAGYRRRTLAEHRTGAARTTTWQRSMPRCGRRSRSSVQPKNVTRALDKHFESKPSTSNKYRALLSVMFTYAVRKSLRNSNPVSEVAGATEAKRDRYITDAELDEVRAAAMLGNDDKPMPSGPPIVALIDLAYQTAQRIGDLLALNWTQVSDEGIMFHPAKTVNSSGVRMLIMMTPELKATLEKAKAGKVKAIGPVSAHRPAAGSRTAELRQLGSEPASERGSDTKSDT